MGDTKPSKDVSESKVAGNTGCVARILTWNINGLRKVAKSHGGLKALLGQFDADIGESLLQQYRYPGILLCFTVSTSTDTYTSCKTDECSKIVI